jgi:hypothetical protein
MEKPMAENSFDWTTPATARVYNYLIGGKNWYEADRRAAEQLVAINPTARMGARANRDFMLRATQRIGQAGIDQFLDIGTGIPTEPNLHDVALDMNPDSRVVYVDNDPLVLTHARALMACPSAESVHVVDADAAYPDYILIQAQNYLDFTRPVAVSFIAVLHFLGDKEANATVARIAAALVPGSYLTVTNGTGDFTPNAAEQGVRIYQEHGVQAYPRTRAEFARFFEGFEILEPGIVGPHRWHPVVQDLPEGMDEKVSMWAGVGRKK